MAPTLLYFILKKELLNFSQQIPEDNIQGYWRESHVWKRENEKAMERNRSKKNNRGKREHRIRWQGIRREY